ncbi:PASTA domain-containing protein [Nocardioides exalbidus]|uniref:PASTA domain-containing protein n=1 Tax=Nocardioides exalbidus TaxID=402596 RepID=A0A1H4KAS8_9ACTN|nr:PASTA domain-containing protein [Nocardioides exalbidus]SEB55664.1 PASTA domain-containing protein [Nocardioides exalbidus]
MDIDEYRAARRTRLVELATELGVPAEESAVVVDQVIEEQQRRIRRADDPDDVVVPALRDRILGGRQRGRSATVVPLVACAAVVLAVSLAYVTRDEDRAPTMPSLLGFTAAEATRTLERDDIAVHVVGVPQCNPAGQVLGSDPPAGSAIGTDEVVTVIATSTPQWKCPADGDSRARAWTFLRFLVGGSAHPDFAPGVRLYVDGEQVTVVDGGASASSPGWRSAVSDPVLQYVSRPAPNPLGQPVVSVSQGTPPATTCGHPRATPVGAVVPSTRLVLMAGGPDAVNGCGLTIDLFEDVLGKISGVALYTPGTAAAP